MEAAFVRATDPARRLDLSYKQFLLSDYVARLLDPKDLKMLMEHEGDPVAVVVNAMNAQADYARFSYLLGGELSSIQRLETRMVAFEAHSTLWGLCTYGSIISAMDDAIVVWQIWKVMGTI